MIVNPLQNAHSYGDVDPILVVEVQKKLYHTLHQLLRTGDQNGAPVQLSFKVSNIQQRAILNQNITKSHHRHYTYDATRLRPPTCLKCYLQVLRLAIVKLSRSITNICEAGYPVASRNLPFCKSNTIYIPNANGKGILSYSLTHNIYIANSISWRTCTGHISISQYV